MNVIVVFEDQATKHRQESSPYAFAGALEVRCMCGNFIHPIPGAWCTRCGAKVVEVRQEHLGSLLSRRSFTWRSPGAVGPAAWP
jgi:hypothetical protein